MKMPEIDHQRCAETSKLIAALETIEHLCQTLRWRLDNFTEAQSIRLLGTEIGSLTEMSNDVSRLYGRLEVLADTEFTGEAAPPHQSDAKALN